MACVRTLRPERVSHTPMDMLSSSCTATNAPSALRPAWKGEDCFVAQI